VLVFTTVTLAFGTTAPEVSVTVPWIAAYTLCAIAVCDNMGRITTASTTAKYLFRIISSTKACKSERSLSNQVNQPETRSLEGEVGKRNRPQK
jgi:hypothetical protein